MYKWKHLSYQALSFHAPSLWFIPCTAFLHPVHLLPVSASHRLYGWSIFAVLWLLQLKSSNSWIWHWEWPCCNNMGISRSCTVTKWITDALEAVTQISFSLSLSVLVWMLVCSFICIYVATWSKDDSIYGCNLCRKIVNAHVVLQEMRHLCFDNPKTYLLFRMDFSE